MKPRVFIIIFCAALFSGYAQQAGIRTNLLYWATTTPNIGLDVKLSGHASLGLSGSYNPFKFKTRVNKNNEEMNSKLHHWLVIPEFKYWFCRTYERSYLSFYGIYGEYNVGGISFIKPLKDYRYRGDAYGGGVSWGYQWALGSSGGIEFSLGAGYLRMHYKKYDCGKCGDELGTYNRNYIGPTQAALSLIYYIK